MAKLDIIIGPMFASKSYEILRRVNLLAVCNRKYLIVKPQIDTRYANNQVVTHNNEKMDCLSIDNLNSIYDNLNGINTLFIDEAQFFDNLVEPVLKIVEEYNINVVVAGLDGDSNRKKFGKILDLIPYSDTCVKLTALCDLCKDGTPGIFSHRKIQDNNQICLGAKSEYVAVCRKCYLSN